MGFKCEFHLPTISHQPFVRFSLNITQILLNELLCRTHDSATQTKEEGHSSRSWVLPFEFGVCPISPEPHVGAQWLSGRELDSRPRGSIFDRHCVVSLSKNINPSLVLVQLRKTRPYITERLLMGCKESNQTNLLNPLNDFQ